MEPEHKESTASPLNQLPKVPSDGVLQRYEQNARGPEQAGQPIQDVSASHDRTGIPHDLRANLEQMSGFDLSGVRVHHNSSKPAAISALAYAQGQDIHLGPGQEQHLPHEAWHVVQQMQGRVMPTTQADGVPVNDANDLEQEADVMGGKASQMMQGDQVAASSAFQRSTPVQQASDKTAVASPVVQRQIWIGGDRQEAIPDDVPGRQRPILEEWLRDSVPRRAVSWGQLGLMVDQILRGRIAQQSEPQARAGMQHLAAGNADAISGESPGLRDEIRERDREYGLIEDPSTGKFHIFQGEAERTNWEDYTEMGFSAVAHTHPYPKSGERSIGSKKLSEISTHLGSRTLVFPSSGDIKFAHAEGAEHTVYTPYLVASKEKDPVVTDPGEAGTSNVKRQLYFRVIPHLPLVPGRYRATVIAYVNSRPLHQYFVEAHPHDPHAAPIIIANLDDYTTNPWHAVAAAAAAASPDVDIDELEAEFAAMDNQGGGASSVRAEDLDDLIDQIENDGG